MAYFEKDEIKDLYQEAKDEAYEWRRNYPEYERLADNGLIDDLDEDLPETNDGSLAAALYKLPKRTVDDNLTGRAKALDADDEWVTELANIYWTNKILPNANAQAPYTRKHKDVIRKAAIYGGQPVISLMMDKGDSTYADFIVPYCQDVRLEPGKVSDLDSDIIFWDVYYTIKQVKDLLEQAKKEKKENPIDGYNKWDTEAIQKILDSKTGEEDRDQNEEHEDKQNRSVKKGGIKFCIAFQRGIKAPFYMYHNATDSTVREWENPDPTGEIPVKYMYYYQDFNNPYGVGVCKLAGGTQNVLDIMRQYDVLATQLGIRPARMIRGNEDEVDEDSMIYAQDANWYVGNAEVTIVEMANGVYNQLPTRQSMYKTSLNQMIPTGDTSISAEAGDPTYSKTPAGVKFQQASLSIDDEDIIDNFHIFYESVAKDLVNLTFANMQGKDILLLSDDEIQRLIQAGMPIPMDEEGNPLTNEIEIEWDKARSTFDFNLDAEDSKAKDEEKRLEGLLRIVELRATDPTIEQSLMMSGKRLNIGELFSSIIGLTTDNDKIIEDISPEELQGMGMPGMEGDIPQEGGVPQEGGIDQGEVEANMQAVMAEHGVDQETAAEMLEAEFNGEDPNKILEALGQAKEVANG